jgi:hypothetical protein
MSSVKTFSKFTSSQNYEGINLIGLFLCARHECTWENAGIANKSPYRPLTDPEGSTRLRLTDFKTIGT